MKTCSQCALWETNRLCPVVDAPLCAVCCNFRRLDQKICPADCPAAGEDHPILGNPLLSPAAKGSWLAPRLRVFGSLEEMYVAALDLEETICQRAMERPYILDNHVIPALEHLVDLVNTRRGGQGAPNELGEYLETIFLASLRGDTGEKRGLSMMAFVSLEKEGQLDLLNRLKEIISTQMEDSGYLERSKAFFTALRKTGYRKKSLDSIGGGKKDFHFFADP